MRFARKFKIFRREKKLSQKELARRLKCSQAYISAIENGRRVPSIKMLEKIENFFGINMGWWFEEREREILFFAHQLDRKLEMLSSLCPVLYRHFSRRLTKLLKLELLFLDELLAFCREAEQKKG